ncbi:MAG: heavy-metal-associated domain-containing protein [Phycisphaerales bacterium]|nr:heavy-metal-associated domain-containing protein [Chloroflexota bacterium]MBY0307545.1 heavy-metal-associated domain-containing protein [Phycisphaerales bacterium]
MKTTLKIEGMRCAGCAGSVERALVRIKGVLDVKVDREKGYAVVEHADSVAAQTLADLVNEIGFTARPAPR